MFKIQNLPITRPKVVNESPFWGDVGVKKWSQFFYSGTRSPIFGHLKMGTFAKNLSLRNLKARPPAWRPPPQHLEAAAAYHIIVSICQMMAMGPKGLCAVLVKSEIREGSVFRSLGII